ncbi:nitrite reductase (NO-forming) [Propionibacterium cyclohexanicum]|uniref:Copper-containing nitrite reductase n=1 Tax=Propionibacterium cyclohexanicum TaxID=64702 RepID=A0A1H9RIH8_9ACTN|nr:multicopper oxidase domain-containing protein [Propionibacterium cyclohexanicum]SER72514.1 nitrite reductase (NO-forming) [Propionibacterium cyclohexanicum]
MTDKPPVGPNPAGPAKPAGTSGGKPAPAKLPGEHTDPISRTAGLITGLVIVVCVTVAALLVHPGPMARSTPQSGPGTASSQPPVAPTGQTTTVQVEAKGMSFTPNRIDVPAGNRLEITLTNKDSQSHDLVLASGAALPTLAPGQSATLDAGIISSDVDGWCSLTGHRQMGMTLQIVTEGGSPSGAATSAASGAMGTPGGASGSGDVAIPTMTQLKDQAATEDPYPASLPPLDGSTEHNVTLTVTEHTQQLAPGVTRQVWTYNGTTPGPVLHGRVGDTFHITLVNQATMGHSIDFHAGSLSPDQPMRTISPGQSLQYDFTATKAGIWMYHCSTVPMSVHIASGMFGAVVIEPDGLAPVDKSYVLIQSELYLGANGQPADATKVATAIPDLMAFNGMPFQYDSHPLSARAGQRVRIWTLDAGPNDSWAFHVVGAQFDTVWTEGAYRIRDGRSAQMPDGSAGAQVLPLSAAQGGFVEFVPPAAGHYAIVNHEMSLAEKGAHATLAVS